MLDTKILYHIHALILILCVHIMNKYQDEALDNVMSTTVYTVHINLLPLFVENTDSETVLLAVGVALGVFLAVLVTTVVLIVVSLICKK